MKKWFLYSIVIVVIPILSFLGLGGQDVGQFYPVQAVMIRADKLGLQIQTDGGQMGKGKDLQTALEDLYETSERKVFLDTADYLLIEPGIEACLSQVKQYLRPSCNLCYATQPVDLAEVAVYLKTHEPKLTLTQYEAGERQVPTIIYIEGRMKLV